MNDRLNVAIVGAGIDGLAVAGALRHEGFTNIRIYEQASQLVPVGADAVVSLVPRECIQLGRKLVGLAQAGGEVTLAFEDGTKAFADLVIGADGVHSTVRDIVLGPQGRHPLSKWSEGRIVLLGDACHPTTPQSAQGAARSTEDAAALARCLAEVDGDDIEGALRRYEAQRRAGESEPTTAA